MQGIASVNVNVARAAELSQLTAADCTQYGLSSDYVGYYGITSPDDLMAFDTLVNGGTTTPNGVVITDIDMTGKTWVPIGKLEYQYGGTFDGNGHEIQNLNLGNSNITKYLGLFGYLNNATIKKVGLTGTVASNMNNTTDNVGGIAGRATNGSKILNCYNEITTTMAGEYIGGIVGYLDKSIVEDCYNTAALETGSYVSYAGGIVGFSWGGTINRCYNEGDVIGPDNCLTRAGGIAGSFSGYDVLNRGKMQDCYITGDCKGWYVGGITGEVSIHNFGGADIDNCYSGCTLTKAAVNYTIPSVAGGILGAEQGLSSGETDCYVTNCIYDSTAFPEGNVYGKAAEPDHIVNCEGKAGTAFSSGEICYRMNNSRFADDAVWFQNLDNDGTVDAYPVLDSTHGVVYKVNQRYSNDPNGVVAEFNTIALAHNATQIEERTDSITTPTALSLTKGDVFTWQGSGSATIQYYVDKEGNLTTTANSGATNNGTAPATPGTYYVKVTTPKIGVEYKETTSEYFTYVLSYNCEISIGDNRILHWYTGNPLPISLDIEDEDITWDNAGTVTDKECIYYVDKSGTETTRTNSGALAEGGAPVNIGDYYVKVTLTFDDVIKVTSEYLPYTIYKHYAQPKQKEDGTYLLSSKDDLYWFAGYVRWDYIFIGNDVLGDSEHGHINAELTSDIVVNEGDVTGCQGVNTGNWIEWHSIGTASSNQGYYGKFDGKGHTISGLFTKDGNGLFGVCTGAEVKNVSVKNSYIESGSSSVGGICGSLHGSISNVSFEGTVIGNENVSGICGENAGIVQNSHSVGRVYGNRHVGGISGLTDNYNKPSGAVETGENVNCYYKEGTLFDAETGLALVQTEKPAEEKSGNAFASGEVAYLLNQFTDTTIGQMKWYQNLTDTKDAYPVLDAAHKEVVKDPSGDNLYMNPNSGTPNPGTPSPAPGTPSPAPGTPSPAPGTPSPAPGTQAPASNMPVTPTAIPGTSQDTLSAKLPVGSKFTDVKTKNIYKVTVADMTVACIGNSNKKVKTVTIPNKITYNGTTFKVTSIGANAFKNYKKLTKVTIGSGITSIGKQAFSGCKALKNIAIKTKKLIVKTVGSKAFKGIYKKASIKVPANKKKIYKKILKAKGVSAKAKIK